MLVLGTPNSVARAGKAGRYMSMANGLMTLSAPSKEMMNSLDRWIDTASHLPWEGVAGVIGERLRGYRQNPLHLTRIGPALGNRCPHDYETLGRQSFQATVIILIIVAE